jgi:hypothetical protein
MTIRSAAAVLSVARFDRDRVTIAIDNDRITLTRVIDRQINQAH